MPDPRPIGQPPKPHPIECDVPSRPVKPEDEDEDTQ